MNGIGKLLIGVFYLNVVFLSIVYAQQAPQDSIANSPVDKAESFFNHSIKQQSRLYNGSSFINYGPAVDGSANFQDLTTFINGNVVYDGFRFNNIPLMYDLFEDKVITQRSRFAMYSLVNERVSDFYINNHHFKYVNVIDTITNIIKPGFFDFIFEGRSKILVKRKKTMQQTIENRTLRYYFVPKTLYYLEKDQKYYVISGKRSFLNYFKDKKTELRKRLKESKIKFRKNPDEAMVLLATYYESLLY
jgi:hypothetical protein